MSIIYVQDQYKPKRKSKKIVKKSPKFVPEFKPLQFKMPAAYRPNDIPSLSCNQFMVHEKPKEQIYSGEQKLLGIGILHKSCLQPVFSKEDAIDIAHMRR